MPSVEDRRRAQTLGHCLPYTLPIFYRSMQRPMRGGACVTDRKKTGQICPPRRVGDQAAFDIAGQISRRKARVRTPTSLNEYRLCRDTLNRAAASWLHDDCLKSGVSLQSQNAPV